MKLDDLAKMKRRKNKMKSVVEARELLQMADIYIQQGKGSEAMAQYRQALKLSHDRDPEIEGLCHFKIGRLIMQGPSPDLEKARNHIVDF
jgi:predicted negative regulator of RcsB-dependent stress response